MSDSTPTTKRTSDFLPGFLFGVIVGAETTIYKHETQPGIPLYNPANDVQYQAERQYFDKHYRAPDTERLAAAEQQLHADLELWREIRR